MTVPTVKHAQVADEYQCPVEYVCRSGQKRAPAGLWSLWEKSQPLVVSYGVGLRCDQARCRPNVDLASSYPDLPDRHGENSEDPCSDKLVRTRHQGQVTRATDRMSRNDHSEVVESSLQAGQAWD